MMKAFEQQLQEVVAAFFVFEFVHVDVESEDCWEELDSDEQLFSDLTLK